MKKLFNPSNWLIGALFFTTACHKDSLKVEAVNLPDVAYGTNAQQRMDIYLPANRTTASTPVLVLIHEGAWSDGDKSGFDTYIPELQERLPGYAIFNINYRLAGVGGNTFPAQENDVKAALDYIYSRREGLLISSNFGLIGASAGGHLALLQAYKYNAPVKPAAVVSFFGPTNLVDLYNYHPLAASVLTNVIGFTPTQNPTIYNQSSPINFVDANSPPTMLLHGGVDPVVPISQAQDLNVGLQTAGVDHEYIVYPTEGHGWFGANLEDSFDKIAVFLKAHME